MVADAARPLILVVDDYPDAREMYTESLVAAGFAVTGAGSGEEAIDQALALTPAAIIMDVSLPGIDGWTATRELKADPRTAAIPVLAVTGHSWSNAHETAREVGCEGLLVKPCLPDEMVHAVKRLLNARAGPPTEAT